MTFLNNIYSIDGKDYSFNVIQLTEKTISKVPSTAGVFLIADMTVHSDRNSNSRVLSINPHENLQQQAKNAYDNLKEQYENIGFQYYETNNLL